MQRLQVSFLRRKGESMINQLLSFIRDIFKVPHYMDRFIDDVKKADEWAKSVEIKNYYIGDKTQSEEEMTKYKFSNKSLAMIDTCEPDLQMILSKVMEWQVMDFTVICGVRTKEEQKKLVAEGKSKTLNSKHLPNRFGMSEAVDIAPYPINWNDTARFYVLSGLMHAAAAELGVKIRWGGDWDSDGDLHDSKFIDLPHFELVGNYGV